MDELDPGRGGTASGEAAIVLDVEDLHTSFETSRGVAKAVDGVSLTIAAGTTLGVVGESGSGKTILIRSIMGLLPRRGVRRTGSVRLAGEELTALPDRRLRARWGAEVAMVFQNPMTSLNPVRTVGAQVAAPLRVHLGLRGRDARRMAAELLRAVGIPEAERRLDDHPHQLSGGMRQRVGIAIALSCGPRLLLADEPTTALDVTVQRQVLELLSQEKEDRRMAVLLVTHDLGVVASHSDEVAVMYAGRVVERAPTRTLFADVRMPYTEALFESIPRIADPSHTPLPAIGGRPPDLLDLPAGCAFADRCRYAQEQCLREAPELRPLVDDPRHWVACWYPLPSGRAGQGGRG